MNAIVDAARRQVIGDLMAGSTLKRSWPVWHAEISSLLGGKPTARDILGLGSHLSQIFRTTGEEGREQGSLSSGGVAWESLVCWYLNLALVGTSAIVIKKASQVPKPVREGLTVKYHQVIANTESDLVAVTFPENDPLLDADLRKRESPFDRLSLVAEARFHELRVAVVQCKTNWNDNAQIPMLWDMIYKAKFDEDTKVSVGIENRALKSLRYAFVTVPSNSKASYESDSLCVRRISQLSGGTYWGRPSKSSVAYSVREIFAGAGIGPGKLVEDTLSLALPELPHAYSYFGVLVPLAASSPGASVTTSDAQQNLLDLS